MTDFIIGAQIDAKRHERTAKNAVITSSDLTTHGVIVGMTGSGKTGLGVVVIEDALRSGVPALLIDPKGDLTNLCLTFARLAPAEFEPWVNEGDARQLGQTVSEFAAAQAKTWTDGLAAWGLGAADIAALRDNVEFTIYTPGSNAGVGVNIVGSMRAPGDMADAEVVGDEIEGFVSSLLSLIGIVVDPLSSREHILLSNLIQAEWTTGRDLDLATLVGMVATPPIRKLGVFDLDTFFPPDERMALAIRLNGLLASPSFGAWMTGPPLDIASMLHTTEGKPRCAIVCTAHLGEQERQFATTLILSKLVTWMRRQSGTTDLRALLYMDEVAGYLPPTATPPTKKPIMTLMKQARAFGVGVVLSTQNPVDIDYKALSNAGTWMIGRLQTDQDKQRLLDGMSAASGAVDVKAIGATIGGLAKREFVLRRAGRDEADVFTTRWAMSYLRGPLTRDQIALLMAEQKARTPVTPVAENVPRSESSAGPITATETVVMPEVASGIAVRWADIAAPWLPGIGGDPRGTRYEAAIVARIALHYDDEKAGLLHDEQYEAVVFPLAEQTDMSSAVGVDYDDRDLRSEAPARCVYRLSHAPTDDKLFWTRAQRDLIDFLVRSRTVDLQTNRDFKLFGRPGEAPDSFAMRCVAVADAKADAETAALRGKYHDKVLRIQTQLETAAGRAEVLHTEQRGRQSQEVLSTAGSILGGLLGGSKSRGGLLGSVLGTAGAAAGRRTRSAAASDRAVAAQSKVESLHAQLEQLELDLGQEVLAIDQRWTALAANVTTMPITLERTDVRVIQLNMVWVPVP